MPDFARCWGCNGEGEKQMGPLTSWNFQPMPIRLLTKGAELSALPWVVKMERAMRECIFCRDFTNNNTKD